MNPIIATLFLGLALCVSLAQLPDKQIHKWDVQLNCIKVDPSNMAGVCSLGGCNALHHIYVASEYVWSKEDLRVHESALFLCWLK
jgi:hypothetical protein